MAETSLMDYHRMETADHGAKFLKLAELSKTKSSRLNGLIKTLSYVQKVSDKMAEDIIRTIKEGNNGR